MFAATAGGDRCISDRGGAVGEVVESGPRAGVSARAAGSSTWCTPRRGDDLVQRRRVRPGSWPDRSRHRSDADQRLAAAPADCTYVGASISGSPSCLYGAAWAPTDLRHLVRAARARDAHAARSVVAVLSERDSAPGARGREALTPGVGDWGRGVSLVSDRGPGQCAAPAPGPAHDDGPVPARHTFSAGSRPRPITWDA